MSLREPGSWLPVLLASLLVGAFLAVDAAAASLPPLLVPRLANVVTANPANANRRVGLIIGNAAYRPSPQPGANWPILANTRNDVKLIADALAADGFEVTTLTDGTHDDIARGVAHFEAETAGAKAAFIYYAGHGFEYAGRNYLVPIDAPVSVSAAELPLRFIDLDQITAGAGQANGLNLIFLDACRTAGPVVTIAGATATPHASVDLDLPPQTATTGAQVAVFYSTALGQPAFDGAPPQSGNSPFAWNVAQMLKAPRLELSEFFRAVTYEVERQTHGMTPLQQPYFYASVHDDFYLRDALEPAGADPAGTTTPAPTHLTISDHDLETVDEPILAARVLRQYSPAQVEAMAEAGDPLATYLLGYFYEFGVGVPKDMAKARSWLERAAATRHPAGELELAYFLAPPNVKPAPPPADQARALSLYEQAAAQGYAKAKTFLAFSLLNDTLGKSDPARAVSLYQDAAAAGHPDAMYQLAMLSLDPRWANDPRFKLDRKGEITGLAALAQAGDIEANASLCKIADAGPGVAADIGDCTIAAQGGDAYAQACLAIYYHDGRAAPEADYQARHWTRLALSQASVLPPGLASQLTAFGY